MMENALILENVSKRYSDFMLDNINITLPAGYIMGFIGENGAGKSTTIKLIFDLIKRDSGKIEVLGKENNNGFKELKEYVGVVMDESCFPENINAVNINSVMKRIYRTWDGHKFKDYMDRFSLPIKKNVKDYSKGMKMKLSIAAALSHESRLLVLDEATSGLDPVMRDEMLDIFLEFIQNGENSVFMSSHITSDFEKICDYITFIHKGKIVLSETREVIFDEYGLLKGTRDEIEGINKNAVIGIRSNSFGTEALVRKSLVQGDFVFDAPTIDDIMLYYVKEKR